MAVYAKCHKCGKVFKVSPKLREPIVRMDFELKCPFCGYCDVYVIGELIDPLRKNLMHHALEQVFKSYPDSPLALEHLLTAADCAKKLLSNLEVVSFHLDRGRLNSSKEAVKKLITKAEKALRKAEKSLRMTLVYVLEAYEEEAGRKNLYKKMLEWAYAYGSSHVEKETYRILLSILENAHVKAGLPAPRELTFNDLVKAGYIDNDTATYLTTLTLALEDDLDKLEEAEDKNKILESMAEKLAKIAEALSSPSHKRNE